MPKVILEFNLPEDRDDFDLALNGWKYKSVIEEFYQSLRKLSKYEDREDLKIDEIRELLKACEDEYFSE